MDTWGLLPKSQIDPQTIEELVDAKILAHTQDPVSHTGTDESLAAHREYGILDHKPGSVLADKATMSEFVYKMPIFESALWTEFANNGGVLYDSPPGIILGCYDLTEYCYIQFLPNILDNWFNWSKDMFAQWTISNPSHEQAFATLGFGSCEDVTMTTGFGFVINEDVLYAYFWLDTSGGDYFPIAFDPEQLNIVRAHYTVSDNTIRYYLNGELAGSIVAERD